MIYDDVELHNVFGIHPVNGGVRLQRVPEDVREHLEEGAQIRVMQPDNCEIRFVSDSAESCVTLSSEGKTDVTIFNGTFDERARYTIGQEPTTIRLCPQNHIRRLDRKWWKGQPFAPNVRRVIFGGARRDPVILHDIQGKGVRPPYPEELPGIRYLAYGTSITHGFDCAGPHLSYVAQVAWHLKADLINLGVGGACHCATSLRNAVCPMFI